MKWKKRGLLFESSNQYNWIKSHAMLPSIYPLNDDTYRVFISGRNEENVSLIGYLDVRIKGEDIEVITISEKPVLKPGLRGCFDDNGVTPSCLVSNGDVDYLYYIGWNSGNSTIRMSLVAGVARGSAKEGKFERISRAPMLERTDLEPYSIATAPFVLKLGVNDWRMWYVSGVEWRSRDLPAYNIKCATSTNGINWKREGRVAIDFAHQDETALARPWVLFENGIFTMFFSYKDPRIGYRIGVATSKDGEHWDRQDNRSGIDVSEEGWDSEMIEYTAVFKHKGIYFMLYNGNNYGADGIGYAVADNIRVK